ncbi:MAG: hypothetical protein CMJ48_14255 [Planctomycetaceae bacterium]|nr:hypothetical protein [Planctomycetaceae bacterium]
MGMHFHGRVLVFQNRRAPQRTFYGWKWRFGRDPSVLFLVAQIVCVTGRRRISATTRTQVHKFARRESAFDSTATTAGFHAWTMCARCTGAPGKLQWAIIRDGCFSLQNKRFQQGDPPCCAPSV